jgi:DTW domain-containing protein YfiP
MLEGLCVCALIPAPPLATRTRVVLIVHRDEARKPTNTGLLALRCLANGEVVVRGRPDEPEPAITTAPGTRAVVLFPSDDAVQLDRIEGPITLFVPDGTWRQAAKVRRRVPSLRDVPCATLPPGEPSRYRLRAEPVAGGLATFEAIARALAVLEGPAIRAQLEPVFDAMVERTLWSRGALPTAAVRSGVPAEAIARWRR